MKRIFLLILGILVISLIAVGGIWLFRKPQSSTTTGTSSTTSFPISTATSSVATTVSQISLTAQSGATVKTNDFINAPNTIPDTENPGNYLLAGSLGYCLPNMRCTAAATTDFNILYDSQAQTFMIALLNEPLSQSRKEAEQFMEIALGVSDAQLCSLKYYIGTTADVNEAYDSENLGFSFCPGAVNLP